MLRKVGGTFGDENILAGHKFEQVKYSASHTNESLHQMHQYVGKIFIEKSGLTDDIIQTRSIGVNLLIGPLPARRYEIAKGDRKGDRDERLR